MRVVTGKVVNGRIEVEGCELPEGAEVEIYICHDQGVELTTEEIDDLDKAIAKADRGEGAPVLVVLDLRAMRDSKRGQPVALPKVKQGGLR